MRWSRNLHLILMVRMRRYAFSPTSQRLGLQAPGMLIFPASIIYSACPTYRRHHFPRLSLYLHSCCRFARRSSACHSLLGVVWCSTFIPNTSRNCSIFFLFHLSRQVRLGYTYFCFFTAGQYLRLSFLSHENGVNTSRHIFSKHGILST